MAALSELSDQQRAEAQRRFKVLRPHLEDGVALSRAAAAAGIPARTARHWLARFDRHPIGLILIGMHRYEALSADELRFVLTYHWQRLGLTLSAEDFTDSEAVAAVARITNGNFRLVHRAQITRILEINQLTTVTNEVVQAARDALVIGQP